MSNKVNASLFVREKLVARATSVDHRQAYLLATWRHSLSSDWSKDNHQITVVFREDEQEDDGSQPDPLAHPIEFEKLMGVITINTAFLTLALDHLQKDLQIHHKDSYLEEAAKLTVGNTPKTVLFTLKHFTDEGLAVYGIQEITESGELLVATEGSIESARTLYPPSKYKWVSVAEYYKREE